MFQLTLSTPKTSRAVFSSSFMSGRERFLPELTTTSPQCFGTVPPELGRLVCDACSEVTVRWGWPSSGVGDAEAEMGVWRVAWGWR